MTPDQIAARELKNALSALLLAAAFVSEPEVWPGFVAFMERSTGISYGGHRQGMAMAMQIAETIRAEVEASDA